MKSNKKGFIVPLVFIIIALLATGGTYFYLKNKQTKNTQANATDQTVSPIPTAIAKNPTTPDNSTATSVVHNVSSTSTKIKGAILKITENLNQDTTPLAVQTVPLPNIIFTANDKTNLIVNGTQSVRFVYSSANSKYCNRSQGVSNWMNSSNLPTSSIVELKDLLPIGTNTYTLTCYNSAGASSSSSVTVTVVDTQTGIASNSVNSEPTATTPSSTYKTPNIGTDNFLISITPDSDPFFATTYVNVDVTFSVKNNENYVINLPNTFAFVVFIDQADQGHELLHKWVDPDSNSPAEGIPLKPGESKTYNFIISGVQNPHMKYGETHNFIFSGSMNFGYSTGVSYDAILKASQSLTF